MPLEFTNRPDDIWAYALKNRDEVAPNIDKWLRWVGSNYAPQLIFDYVSFVNVIPIERHAALVTAAWSNAEQPQIAFPAREWIPLFRRIGFTFDGQSAEPPTEPVRLYRGAVESRKRRMSWTTDIDVAKDFASGRIRSRRDGQVWTTVAQPANVVARIDTRQEAEYLVDMTSHKDAIRRYKP